ncbi:MAG: sn-glycerol-3-phosphate ABC transporter substrate-binding protein UgpB [Burkholderiales bacterium]|nr:sn-glycerol-3-phosphate ABC transporter substrate-binding protein UgpB [Burkholderiales bacterium]
MHVVRSALAALVLAVAAHPAQAADAKAATPAAAKGTAPAKPAAKSPVEIELWHAMDGALGDELNGLVAKFNASQGDYVVKAVYKGSYDDTLAAAAAAQLQGKQPALVQAYDVATANLMVQKRMTKPLHQVLAESGVKIDRNAFVPAVASYYSDAKGNLMALPFNASTPVFFYNKDLFKKAGIDPEARFKTWYDVQAALLKLNEANPYSACGLTTTWPAWVLVENTLTLHNEEFATKNNGFDGPDAQLTFNTRLAIRHLSLLTSWIKSRLFEYHGRRDEAEGRFVKGECAMLTASSASYGEIWRKAGFQFGVMPMPYYDDINQAPYHSTMGGGSLWALAGKKPEEYKGAARFLAYLAQPEVQAAWHQATGYLPITRAAYELTRSAGYYQRYPGTEVPIQQIIGQDKGPPQAYSRGVRLGNQAGIRAILDEEIEQAFQFKKPPKQALDDAAARGNELLRQFQRQQGGK